MTLSYVLPKDAQEFLASKWIHIQFLVEPHELEKLFASWGNLYIFSCMGMNPEGKSLISQPEFLDVYGKYIDTLKNSKQIDDKEFRPTFTAIMTKDVHAVQAIRAKENHEIIRATKPIIQSQIHRFDYSQDDGKFRSKVFGSDTLSWGLQFSYPQLYQDPTTRENQNALNAEIFPNASLFQQLRSWIRTCTIPTPFVVVGKKIHSPIRISKESLSWIEKHPDLREHNIQVSRQPPPTKVGGLLGN